MRNAAKVFWALSTALLLVQCGKETPTSSTRQRSGHTLLMAQPGQPGPVDLPSNQSGTVYEIWACSLRQVAPFKYLPTYQSMGRFGWDNISYNFLNESGQPRSGIFPGSSFNLFSPNVTHLITPETLEVVTLAIGENDTVRLRQVNQVIVGVKALMVSVEPAGETGPGLALPERPLLVGYCSDSGVVRMNFVVNNRKAELRATYFLATPSDSTRLMPVSGCCIDTTSFARNNESKGLWFGRYDPNTGAAKPDTVFRDWRRPKGWQYEAWIQKNGILASCGKFIRPDSADLDNSHCPDTSERVTDGTGIFNLPGEDFFINSPFSNLLGGMVLISYEPLPDPDPAISGLIFFRDSIRTQTFDPFQRIAINLQTDFILDNRSRFLPIIRAVVVEDK